MRNPLHFCLCAILAVVSFGAPFAHTHDAGKAEEHLKQEHFSVLHAHIPLPNADPAVGEVDESAKRVNWFRFEIEKSVVLATPAPGPIWVVPDLESSTWPVCESTATLPEESPPCAVSPRGPPLLFV